MDTTADKSTEPIVQFGLHDLAWLIVFSGVYLQFANRALGWQPATLFFSVLALAAYLIIPHRCAVPVFPSIICLLMLICGQNWWIFAYVAMLFILGFISKHPSVLQRLRWHTALLACSLVVGSVLNQTYPPRKLERLRLAQQMYPIVDLGGRLETLRPAIPVTPRENVAERSTDDVATVFSKGSGRQIYLELLHDQQHTAFVERLGFGSARMLRVSPEPIKIPALESVAFNENLTTDRYELTVEEPIPLRLHDYKLVTGPALPMSDYVDRSIVDFAHPATLGHSPSPKHSVGFAPHGFRFPLPKVMREETASEFLPKKELQLERLELVSLLRFEAPRVYVIDYLPRMDELSDVDIPTRKMDEFEESALARLIAGETIVTADEKQLRMMGAIPAVDKCLSCHEGKVGGLLGAFSYRFQPTYH